MQDKLKRLCEKFTQQEVADAIGMSRVRVSVVLHGHEPMSRLMTIALEQVDEDDVAYTSIIREVKRYVEEYPEGLDNILYDLPLRIQEKSIAEKMGIPEEYVEVEDIPYSEDVVDIVQDVMPDGKG